MVFKKDILDIINKVVYNNTKDIPWLENRLMIDNQQEILIITNVIFLRMSISNNILILEEIKLAHEIKHRKICFKLIGEFIEFSKRNEILEGFEVSSIISSSMYSICDYYNMEDFPITCYGDVEDDYDFDGFFGSKIIKTS